MFPPPLPLLLQLLLGFFFYPILRCLFHFSLLFRSYQPRRTQQQITIKMAIISTWPSNRVRSSSQRSQGTGHTFGTLCFTQGRNYCFNWSIPIVVQFLKRVKSRHLIATTRWLFVRMLPNTRQTDQQKRPTEHHPKNFLTVDSVQVAFSGRLRSTQRRSMQVNKLQDCNYTLQWQIYGRNLTLSSPLLLEYCSVQFN